MRERNIMGAIDTAVEYIECATDGLYTIAAWGDRRLFKSSCALKEINSGKRNYYQDIGEGQTVVTFTVDDSALLEHRTDLYLQHYSDRPDGLFLDATSPTIRAKIDTVAKERLANRNVKGEKQ